MTVISLQLRGAAIDALHETRLGASFVSAVWRRDSVLYSAQRGWNLQ